MTIRDEVSQSIAREGGRPMTAERFNWSEPCADPADPRQWQAWRLRRIREGQRQRRAGLRRIDYQDVSPEAAAVIDGQCGPFAGGDYSSVLNRIVVEWAVTKRLLPE